jgi:hypothetical protein
MTHRFVLAIRRVLIAGVLLGMIPLASVAQSQNTTSAEQVMIEDFERYTPGTFPERWVFVTSDKRILSYEETRDPGEKVVVKEEEGNQFVRLITDGAALRYTLRNDTNFDWDLRDHPHLQWRWRALHLPEGASERDKNDTGGAVYVTFGTDWLGRPKSIKYTYSSTLSVGTVVSFGPLKVIVVDSAKEPRMGEWKMKRQNVVQDYRQVFGEDPPNRPVSITLWSDSDTTNDSARVDVDDLMLRP